ncbi:MAG TPA: nucleotidyl transferase AbiEii/AbiGii toxin family protein [Conexibacter sp.]
MSDHAAPLDLAGLVRLLTEHGVEFVVVGGLAAIAHGARRMTLDLDIVPDPEPANFRRLAAAVARLGVADETVTDGAFQTLDPRDEVDLARSRNVSLRTAAGQLDVLNRARGAPPYRDLAARAVRLPIVGVEVLVAGVDDLIAMKLASGRPKDLQDVADVTAHEAGEYPPPPEP